MYIGSGFMEVGQSFLWAMSWDSIPYKVVGKQGQHFCASSVVLIKFTYTDLSRYDGKPIVSRSVDMGKPIIYVSMNYRYSPTFCFSLLLTLKMVLWCFVDRLAGFGFLASKEVKKAGISNLGLQDRKLEFWGLQRQRQLMFYRKIGLALGSKIH